MLWHRCDHIPEPNSLVPTTTRWKISVKTNIIEGSKIANRQEVVRENEFIQSIETKAEQRRAERGEQYGAEQYRT